MAKRTETDGNPEYYSMPGLAKFRKIKRGEMTAETKAAYSAALVAAVKSKQDAWWKSERAVVLPNCASGTWINSNENGELHNALRAQAERRCQAQITKDRMERINSPTYRAEYEAAVRETRILRGFTEALECIVGEINDGGRIVAEIRRAA
jgi:hypothetical protein